MTLPRDSGPTFTLEDEGDDDEHEPKRRAVVRVDVVRLDEAMEQLSGLIVTRFRLARAVATLTSAGVNTRELSQIMAENARQLRDLRAAILRVRMVQVSEVLERIRLVVRGLRRDGTKQVRVDIDAAGAELDKAVAERLFPALLHLVRNAVDHGIETPDERVRRHKSADGLLRIVAAHRGNRLQIELRDDGRGISREALAARAGVAVPTTNAALLDLLCRPGLSTRLEVTNTSGRGMGMDIVRRVVEQLGGELSVVTEEGVGTTFVLTVPLTVSIVDAFSFECGAQRYVVPVSMVEEIIELDRARLVRGPGGASSRRGADVTMIERRGEALAVVALDAVFARAESGQAAKAIVVRRGGEAIAFAVDRMIGQQEVVVRPLEDRLLRVPGISGATDLGDGRPTLVLDLVALAAVLSVSAPTTSSLPAIPSVPAVPAIGAG